MVSLVIKKKMYGKRLTGLIGTSTLQKNWKTREVKEAVFINSIYPKNGMDKKIIRNLEKKV